MVYLNKINKLPIKRVFLFRFYFFLTLIFLVNLPLFSADYKADTIITEFKTDINKVAKKYWPKRVRLYQNIAGYRSDLKKWNEHIKDFQNIPVRSKLYIEYPYNPYINYKSHLTLLKDGTHQENWPNFNMSVFVSKSQGNLEELSGTADITSKQNSPFTVGIFLSDIPFNKKFYYSGSFYFSTFTNTINEIDQKSYVIPAEIGGNIYLNYNTFIPTYFGLDFEKLSTFNLDEILTGNNLAIRNHQLLYFTLGLGDSFLFLNKTIILKASYSKAISSNSSQEGKDVKSFSGNKFIIFAGVSINQITSISTFFKRHSLRGITEATINRIGLGINFKLF